MGNSKQEELRKITRNLYNSLVKQLNENGNLSYFRTVVGPRYGQKSPKIIIYGSATNSWDDYDNKGIYSLDTHSKSPFFRMIKRIATGIFEGDKCPYENICWSNVCKAAPYDGGNPPLKLYNKQLKLSADIMKSEIDFLAPDVIIFITGIAYGKRWDDILDEITLDYEIFEKKMACMDDDECSVESYKYNFGSCNPLVIVTGRPEFKTSESLSFQLESILALIADNKNKMD